MRFVALISLAVAAAVGLWYTSNSSLPYYYDAGIFALSITGAVLLVDISPNSPARRPRRIVRDGEGRKSPIIYDSHQIVCKVGPWDWDIEEFCTHWLITGDTGAGKTSSGLNRLLISLTEHYPQWGALILDPKGVYWRSVQIMMNAAAGPTSSPSCGSGLRKNGSRIIQRQGSILSVIHASHVAPTRR